MVIRTLPSISAEDVCKETPAQPRSIPQHPPVSADDLWLEKTQRRRLKQAQAGRQMHAGTAQTDGGHVSSSPAPCPQVGLVSPPPLQVLAFPELSLTWACCSWSPLGPVGTAGGVCPAHYSWWEKHFTVACPKVQREWLLFPLCSVPTCVQPHARPRAEMKWGACPQALSTPIAI